MSEKANLELGGILVTGFPAEAYRLFMWQNLASMRSTVGPFHLGESKKKTHFKMGHTLEVERAKARAQIHCP